MSYLRKMFTLSILSFKGSNISVNGHQYVINKLLVPFLEITFFYIVTMYFRGNEYRYLEFMLIGNSVYMVSLSTVMGIVFTIARDREIGMLPIVLISPIRKSNLFIAKSVLHIIEGVLLGCIGFIFSVLFLGLEIELDSAFLVFVILFLISLSMASLGILLGCLTMILKDTIAFANFALLFLLFVSGVNFPAEELPMSLAFFSKLSPLYYGLEVIRGIIVSKTFSIESLVSMLLVSLGYFLLSICIFKTIEMFALKKSTYE
uniref:ABC transporter permease n=1 Tax=Paenibacillus sp. FSL R10-2734 TaxID=2954691 RepID=UPI00403F3106